MRLVPKIVPFVFFLVCGAAAAAGVPAATIELRVVERQGVARRGEPVTFAVPFPKGELRSVEQVRLLRDGQEVPAQFRATGLWRPEESIRWLLVDLQTDIAAGAQQTYQLEYGDGVSARAKPAAAVRIEESDDAYTVDTGAARFRISRKVFDLFHEVRLADGTVIVPRPDAAQPRYGAVVRGLKPMVTRAIADPANKGRSHLIYVACSPQAGLEDYTLRFTSDREYEVTGAKSGRVGRGAYLKDFSSTDGVVSIPGEAWLPYAYPAEGDVYTFRTIPEGYSAASESVRESTILERGPLRSVIRVKGCTRFGRGAGPGVHGLVSFLRRQRAREAGLHAGEQQPRRTHVDRQRPQCRHRRRQLRVLRRDGPPPAVATGPVQSGLCRRRRPKPAARGSAGGEGRDLPGLQRR